MRNVETPEGAHRSDPPRFYSVPHTARLLTMSPMTIYRAIAAGQFPALRVRGRLVVPARAVEEMEAFAMTEGALVDAAGWVVPGAAAQAVSHESKEV